MGLSPLGRRPGREACPRSEDHKSTAQSTATHRGARQIYKVIHVARRRVSIWVWLVCAWGRGVGRDGKPICPHRGPHKGTRAFLGARALCTVPTHPPQRL